MSNKLDILIFAAHPDDAELGCGGTISKHVRAGKKVGVIDLTKGELGSRGDAELRLEEAENSSKLLKLSARENLGLADGFFEVTKEN
ncbi:MAG: LmbE family N-acetylglucosaminyl deacetylase, partial [Sphingobacteriales bacterium]